MGFFGGKKTYVASTSYNMAGDIIDRPSYLKSLVLGSIIGSSTTNLASTIQQGYIKSPGMKLRSFFRWAENNYDAIGVPKGNLGSKITIDAASVATHIPGVAGSTVQVQRIDAGTADFSFWAEQWMAENHPTLLGTNWLADISEITNEITILFEDESTSTFVPVIDINAQYLYAVYNLVDNATLEWSSIKVFIYKIGSGNSELDNLVSDESDEGEFVPFIPLRIDNKFLSPSFQPAAYQIAKKAYKKSIGKEFDDLITQIADNESIDDIDHAYVVFGVPLNTKENAAKEYLYRFFDKCRLSQVVTNNEYQEGQEDAESYEKAMAKWQLWMVGQDDPENPLNGTPAPVRPNQRILPGSKVVIKNSGPLDTKFNFTIKWGSITQSTGTGLKKPNAKVGEVWLTQGSGQTFGGGIYNGNTIFQGLINSAGVISIHWQTSANSWKTLTISGLVHENIIYKKKSVDITDNEALADSEESGFIVPLHMATVHEMSLVHSTQMMTSAAYIVFNSKKTVKQKWYQTGFFKLIVIIVIVVITVVTAGTGTAPAVGLLGSAAAVGAAIGLTGVAAIIAGSIANALAAMIVSKLIMAGAVELLGEKWGAIVGAIVSFVAINVGTALNTGMSMAQMVSSMSSAANLIGLTNAVGRGVAGYMQGQAMETMEKARKLAEETDKQLDEISRKFAEEFGYGRAALNPMGLTDTMYGNFTEGSEDFLKRTLLTGSDIAEMSIDMMMNYAQYSIQLNLKP